MCFQPYALFPHLSVLENVTFAPPTGGGYTDGNSGESGCALLNQISLAAHSDKFPNTLYGVQQQRVALAGTLVVRLGLVLFDELLSNLDAKLNKYLKIFVN